MNKALIVEDDKDQAELAAQLVRLRDFQPIVAEDGESGYRLAVQYQPAVVLLDLMLPDTSGFEVCRRLRSERATLLTPIVMLTALGDAQHRSHGFRVGANAYVTKPYGAKDLYAAITTARQWKEQLEREHMQGEIHVELNSETTFLQEVNDFLTSLMMSTPLSEPQVMQLRQAVMEMGQNAIEWGNRHQLDELVRITYRIHPDRVEVIVRDQGKGFDRNNLPHVAQPEDPVAHLDVREKLGLREGGFGMLISQGMVDELRYNDPGNEVTLIKRFASADAGPA
ncbi:MAG TPA: ATP-binding protein [Isosphaeraceae bacterium]|jgi:DNA-binding response OmpR family regulator|nr:ATP-binding protein [Isosphaeraceae bacterium]